MNDAGLDKLTEDVFRRIAPVIEGKPNVAVPSALLEVIRAPNNNHSTRSRFTVDHLQGAIG